MLRVPGRDPVSGFKYSHLIISELRRYAFRKMVETREKPGKNQEVAPPNLSHLL
jgi:hypothetical protein